MSLQVKFFKGQRVTHVAAGRYHTAVCTENELYTWGRNIGQLGYSGTDIMQYVPKQVCLVSLCGLVDY